MSDVTLPAPDKQQAPDTAARPVRRIIKALVRIILYGMGACLILMVFYLVWIFIVPYWASLLFFGFLGVGSTIATFDYISSKKQLSGTLQGLLISAFGTSSRSRLRFVIEQVIMWVMIATGGWMYTVYQNIYNAFSKGAHRQSHLQNSLYLVLRGLLIKFSSIALILTFSAYLILYLDPNIVFWARVFLVVVLVNVISRLLNYALGAPSLPARLRRGLTNPLISFLIIAPFDLITLAFVLNGIFKIHVDGTTPMMFADLPAVISAIFFIHILDIARDLINAHNPNVPELVMNTAGALYGFTILESAYRVHEFKRVDDDYLSLANSYNFLGRYADAVSALDKMKVQTVASFRCRAAAFLGVSQFNRAWSDMRTALHLGGQSEVTEGDVFIALWQSAVTYSTPFNVNKVLIERAVALSLSDTRIAGAVFGLGEEDKYKHILTDVFSNSEREKQFPICCTALHLLTKSRDHAMPSRWGRCRPHPSQTRTCRFPASGSSRERFARGGVAVDNLD